ncbi:hypothetical protein CASFOL_031328 [Castilleja foliolosa]|uniref:RING-type E3 ubiquitin transferase n=1 Tax=Castilleja foliolosa TaxID=1961234 RepID=A0ABD3C4D9_9LAMI
MIIMAKPYIQLIKFVTLMVGPVIEYYSPAPYTPYDDNQNNNGTVFGQFPDNQDSIRAEHDDFYHHLGDSQVQSSIRAHESSYDPFFDYSFDDQFDEHESFYGQFADMGSTMTEGDGLSEETITKHLKTSNYPNKGGELCAVCLDGLAESDKKTRIGSLDCGHEYHEACIKQWLTRKNFCPLCKAIGYECDKIHQ